MNQNGCFLNDVVSGLSLSPKKLSSKYFYDERGDKLFHNITHQPEYYLTCAEHQILNNQCDSVFSHINVLNGIRIIEPGAGDGLKTMLLIKYLLLNGCNIIYNPIDISSNVLDILCKSMTSIYPQLLCDPILGDYSNINITIKDDNIKLMLFLGSNLGNFADGEEVEIIKKLSQVLQSNDFFLLGVDMVKNPDRIYKAYNDSNKVTAEFNFNLLMRINRELDADFEVNNFMHYPVYNPVLHQAESYLISKIEHNVNIGAANKQFTFKAWESLNTEISRKFTLDIIQQLAEKSGFFIVDNYLDSNRDFCCSLWKKI